MATFHDRKALGMHHRWKNLIHTSVAVAVIKQSKSAAAGASRELGTNGDDG
jgi:hypothetical protein